MMMASRRSGSSKRLSTLSGAGDEANNSASSSGETSTKKQRTKQNQVDLKILQEKQSSGECEAAVYMRKKNANHTSIQKSIADLEKEKGGELTELSLPHQSYFLHPAFRMALTHLLGDIDSISKSKSATILLIHGVPDIGKSSLAKCLAYYLSLAGDSAWYIKMRHQVGLDSHSATENVLRRAAMSKWIVFDQCNVHNLKLPQLIYSLQGSYRREELERPVIMLTSGHYAPPDSWVFHNLIKFKVINMNINEDMCARIITEQTQETDKALINPKVTELMEITKIFGRARDLADNFNNNMHNGFGDVLDDLAKASGSPSKAEIQSKFYILWLFWPELTGVCDEKLAELLKASKTTPWRISPAKVQLVGHILRLHKDSKDEKHNRIMNLLTIGFNSEREGKSLYSEYDKSQLADLWFYLERFEDFRDIIKNALDSCTPTKLYNLYLSVYLKVGGPDDTGGNSMRGSAFDRLVPLMCMMQEKETSSRQYGIGYFENPSKLVNMSDVEAVLKPESIDDLCEKILTHVAQNKEQHLWAVLNSTEQCDGYDFAFIKVSAGGTTSCQLFQATINTNTHSKHTMATVLRKVRDLLGIGVTVTPYFLTPNYETSPKDKKHKLPNSEEYAAVLYLDMPRSQAVTDSYEV